MAQRALKVNNYITRSRWVTKLCIICIVIRIRDCYARMGMQALPQQFHRTVLFNEPPTSLSILFCNWKGMQRLDVIFSPVSIQRAVHCQQIFFQCLESSAFQPFFFTVSKSARYFRPVDNPISATLRSSTVAGWVPGTGC